MAENMMKLKLEIEGNGKGKDGKTERVERQAQADGMMCAWVRKAEAAGAVRFEVDGMVHGKLYTKIDAEMLGALAATIAKERGWGVWRMLRMAWAIGREMLRFARRAENVGKGEA